MSDPVIRRVRRSIDEAKNRGGMQAGMPKVTIDAGDAERLCIVAESLATTQAENEAIRAQLKETEEKGRVLMGMCRDLRARVAELERDNAHQRERRNAARDCIQKMKAETLRKQAEAVERLISMDNYALWYNREFVRVADIKTEAQHLRQQADEAERAGGEK